MPKMRYYRLETKSIVLKARSTILGILGTFGILGILGIFNYHDRFCLARLRTIKSEPEMIDTKRA
jgi:hypothetical protein